MFAAKMSDFAPTKHHLKEVLLYFFNLKTVQLELIDCLPMLMLNMIYSDFNVQKSVCAVHKCGFRHERQTRPGRLRNTSRTCIILGSNSNTNIKSFVDLQMGDAKRRFCSNFCIQNRSLFQKPQSAR